MKLTSSITPFYIKQFSGMNNKMEENELKKLCDVY